MAICCTPKNTQKLDSLYAIISSDENGEGIISGQQDGQHFPFVFGHETNLERAKNVAQEISTDTRKKLLVVKYTARDVLLEILPE